MSLKPFTSPSLESLSDSDRDRFDADGYLVVADALTADQVDAVREAIPKVFAGDFDTGVYPDEWHWREEMSRPDVTRQICNGWKSNLALARLALSPSIGRAICFLTGWPGARLGQDTVWWKPPQTKAVKLHQDSPYMEFLDPPAMTTCWVALDDTKIDAGTIEYVAGSHRWPITPQSGGFQGDADYQADMKAAAYAAGIDPPPSPVPLELSAGSCVFHTGETWHGSGPNRTGHTTRRSVGVHLLPAHARFTGTAGGYIYRRYQRTGIDDLDDSFFPVVWRNDAMPTPWIDHYCQTGERV